jgi:hypothetical protein
MIIVLSNSLDVTADYICSKLNCEKLNYIRLNTDNLIEETKFHYDLNEISLIFRNRKIKLEEISSVWYRRPEVLKLPNHKNTDEGEAKHTINEWSAMLDGYLFHIPPQLWINHPMNNALASSKIEQLSIAQKLGLITPKTLVSQSYNEIIDFYHSCQKAIIVKPIAHGYIERENSIEDTVIYTNEVTLEEINNNINTLSLCPTFFQEKIDKSCDLRVNIIDKEVVATAIYASEDNKLQATDIRRNNMQNVKYEIVNLPSEISRKLLKICNYYKLRFAAIDLAIDNNNNYIFFEINPNGQWAWLDLLEITDIASVLITSMVNLEYKLK